jgi:hypothetical protein
MDLATLVKKSQEAQRESKYLDFKESCDTESAESWCEIVKDIVAMANSGGGVIVFGVKNDGTISGFDTRALLAYDSAKVTDKIAKYTGRQFADFEFTEVERQDGKAAALIISEATLPIVFTTAGTYKTVAGKEKIAFHQGTVYFRHGSKSEPGNSNDLKDSIERQVERMRRSWLGGIKKVTQAPPGSVFQVATPGTASRGHILGARIVSDPSAPGVRPEGADSIWPHRAKKLIAMVNDQLNGKTKINSYDLQCIRKAFDFDRTHPEFCYRPFALSPPQYSDKCVAWIVEQYKRDNHFFVQLREDAKNLMES